MTRHLYSPAGSVREHSTTCYCGAATWNVCAKCDRHCDCGGHRRTDSEEQALPGTVEFVAAAGEHRSARMLLALMSGHTALHNLHRVENGQCLHCSFLTGQRIEAPCPSMAAAVIPSGCCKAVAP